MQKITPFLWFENQAEEAAKFYTSVFKDSKILNVSHYGEAGPGPNDAVMAVTFQLEGQDFIALNGDTAFNFTPAISLFVKCNTQAEVDHLWEALIADGGEEWDCGWLKDKFGISWQIVPSILRELLVDNDAAKSGKVMQAMMKMKKMDIATLQQAHKG